MAKTPRVSVQFTVNSTGYTASVNKLKAQVIDFGATSKRVSHGMVSDTQAASGALRLIDGGIANNIRSAERFLASIKGVPTVLKAIYPIVGGIAIGAVFARGVSELIAFQQKAKEAGDQFRNSWQEMANASRLGNDELAKTNVQLENQIAKLEGRHENMLALELQESRIEATKLAQAAAGARDKVHQLFAEKGVGFSSLMGAYRMVVKGEAPTTDTQSTMEGYDAQIADTLQDRTDALHDGNQAAADAAQKKYEGLLAAQQGKYRTLLGGYRRMNREGQGNYSANIAALQGGLSVSYSASDNITEEAQNKADERTLKGLQDGKEATAKMMARYREEFAQMQASITAGPGENEGQYHARQLSAEADFWAKRLAITKRGTEAYREIQKELDGILREGNQQYANAQNEAMQLDKERTKFISESFGDNLDLTRSSSTTEDLRAGGRDSIAMVESMSRGSQIAQQNADAWREAQIQIGLAAGTLSQYDAASQVYQLHQEQHARAMAALQTQRDSLTQRYGPEYSATSAEARAAWQDLGNQTDAANGQFQIQQAEDQRNVASQTVMGSWKTTLDQYVQLTRDTASQVREIWQTSLDAVNQELVTMLSTRHNYGVRQQWGNLGAGIFRNVAGIGLQKAEGAIFGALGKPDGSQNNPLFVRLAGAGGVIAGGGGLLDGIIGVGDKAAAGGASGGGWLSKLAGLGGSLIAGLGFAGGGNPPVGVASMVGEEGPELFVPKVPGTIVPNHQLGGVTHNTNLTVDARGSTDPAAVDARIQRALPSIAAAVTHSQQNARARLPMGRRT